MEWNLTNDRPIYLQLEEILLQAIASSGRVLTAEDCVENGSIGQALTAELVRHQIPVKRTVLLNCGSTFAPQGTVEQVYRVYHLDADGIAQRCVEEMKREKTS